MVLADRMRLANTRQLLRAFGGLNETYGCSEAEYSAGVNFSTRDFPALSTRTPAPQTAGTDRAERDVPPERSADRLRTGCRLYPGRCRSPGGDKAGRCDRRPQGAGGHRHKNSDLPGQAGL